MTRYADDNDHASALEEEERTYRLSEIRRSAESVRLKFVGVCYSCSEAVAQPRVFCDRFCADQFEREAAARRRNGGHL